MRRHLVAAVLLLLPGLLHAQAVNSGVGIGPSRQVAQPLTAPPQEPAPAPVVERALLNWGGLRADLGQDGIVVLLDAISEFAGTVSGGTR